MRATERSVLHVLPHPGGGGETYVDLLDDMPGYRFSRNCLAPIPTPSTFQLARGVATALKLGRGHDLVHAHGEVAGGMCIPLLATKPSVVTLHGLHLVRRLSGYRRRAAVLNVRAVLRSANSTVCVSQTEHDELARVVSTGARRAVVIRNGVRIPPPTSDADRAAVRQELGIPGQEPIGIWVGSLDERKDPLVAVRAAREAGVTLLVVGDGPLRQEVERTAGARGRVLGQRGDVPRLLAAADFYVSTSRREGLSLSLLEAMATGLAPIVTDLPENREAVGDAGISYGGDGTLVAALRRLVANDGERIALGQQAQRRVAELFGAEKMITRTRAIYDQVLADRVRERAHAP